MTNELLAEYIQQGDNDELIPILWEKVRNLLYMKSERFYKLHQASCDSSGVEVWDIKQACYGAFLEAVRAYKPGSKFNSYLNFPFKNAVRELLGIRSTRQEPLNNCSSLDKEIESSDGDSCSILDLIADDTALDFVEDVDRSSEAETVRQIVDTLSEPYRSVIKTYFFEGISLTAIGEKLNISPERVRQIKYKALRILRANKQLRQLYTEQKKHYDWLRLARFRYSPEYFEICKRAEERNLSYGQWQADLYSAMHERELSEIRSRDCQDFNNLVT